jgi:CRP-like cAMP-binding protein
MARMTSTLLEGLEPSALPTVLSKATRRTFGASQVLYRTGEPAASLFVVRKGRVKLSRVSRSGHEVVMGILVPGDVCGLGTLLDIVTSYYGTAQSLERTETLVWTRSVMNRLAVAFPQVPRNALRVALGYVATFADRHVELVSSSAPQRLARTLTRLAHQSGTQTPSGVEVAVTNELLASLSDVSPFTASRTLQSWQREGAIRKSRGHICILCPEKLLID